MKKIKAIILNVDGVIVGEKIGFNSPQPNLEVIEKLKKLSNDGIKIVLCTAKPHFAVATIIKSCNLKNPHITDGGGVLISPVENKILKQHIIDNQKVKQVLEMCLKNNVYVESYCAENYVVQKNQLCDITKKHTHILQCEPKIVNDLTKVKNNATKIMPIVNGDEEKAKFTEMFNQLNTGLTLSWGVHPIANPLQFGIITASGISKKNGAIEILNSLNIAVEDTLGIGDSTSDWQFISECKYAGVMENASKELKEKATTKGQGNFFFGGDVDSNGVLSILDYFTTENK